MKRITSVVLVVLLVLTLSVGAIVSQAGIEAGEYVGQVGGAVNYRLFVW